MILGASLLAPRSGSELFEDIGVVAREKISHAFGACPPHSTWNTNIEDVLRTLFASDIVRLRVKDQVRGAHGKPFACCIDRITRLGWQGSATSSCARLPVRHGNRPIVPKHCDSLDARVV